MEAAFFDLDKTVISRASIMAFAGDFRREGLLSRRSMARGVFTQLLYLRLGANSKKLQKIGKSVLATTKGWDQAHVRGVVTDRLSTAIDPITYLEARDLIFRHKSEDRRVYLVSAAPAEIVEPLASHLGADEAIATLAQIDEDGRYTGELERYAYGQLKSSLIHELAAREGIDLPRSYAYSDSATDLPMLECVGHPVAVNPDRVLRKEAERRGWEILRFETLPGAIKEARADRDSSAVKVCAVVAAGVAAAGGAGAVAWRWKTQPQHA